MAAPPPVVPVADLNRYQQFNITSPTTLVDIWFPIFGDGSDLIVLLNGVSIGPWNDLTQQFAWTLVSQAGQPLSNIALPITDAQIQFFNPLSYGLLEIFGQWHPRQNIPSVSPAITRREYQQAIGQIVAFCRETYYWLTSFILPSPATRANQFLGFDGFGNPIAALPSAGAPISAAMQPVVDSATIPNARAALGLGPIATLGVGKYLDINAGYLEVNAGQGLGTDPSFKLMAGLGGQVVFPSGDLTGVSDTANINNAIAASQNSIVWLSGPNYYVNLGGISFNGKTGVRLIGRGPFATILNPVGSSLAGDMLVMQNACQHCGIEDLSIIGNSAQPPIAGWAIQFQGNCFECWTKNLHISYMFNGINIHSCTETRLKGRTILRPMAGLFGVQYSGSAGVPCFRAIIEDISCDNYWPAGFNGGAVVTWSPGTGYTSGQVVNQNDNLYMCVGGGTSGVSGPQRTNFAASVLDGSVSWQFVSSASMGWIVMDSYAYSLVIDKAALIDGAYGFVMNDTVGTGFGGSAPSWAFCFDLECDHNFFQGVLLNGGSGFYLEDGWISSCIQGNGIFIGATWLGEFECTNTRIYGNWQNGVSVSCAKLFGGFTRTMSSGNSQQSAGTYHGFDFAAGVSNFAIQDCYAGVTNVGLNQHGWGVLLNSGASDSYLITNNNCPGNATGTVSDGGSGSNKTVSGNVA